MNISKYSVTCLIVIVLICSFFSCNQTEQKSNDSNFIQSKSGNISIYTTENDEAAIASFIEQHALKDAHLPVDDRYESFLNYIVTAPKSNEEVNQNERILVFFNHNETIGNSGQIPSKNEVSFKNDFNGKLYENVWGKGQKVLVIDVDLEMDAWLQKNFAKLEKALIKMNHDSGLLGVEGYFPKSNISQRKYSDSLEELLMSNYGFSIDIPSNFRIVQADSQFVWITNIEKENGFESVMINIFNTQIDYNQLSELIDNRNLFTHQYLHNDEGTQISVSESGAYNPKLDNHTYTNSNKQSYHQLLGWYTEMGTYRRGPFGRFYYSNKANQTIAIDWFCGGKTTYNISASKLTSIATSFRLKQ